MEQYKIISPATSANMGAGFDCLGVCLSISNSMVFSEYEDAVIINNHADTIRNKSNLIIKSLYEACDVLGTSVKGVKLDIKTAIPLSRGLGSSASCISAGIAAAYMFAGITPNKSDIFELAAKFEGHSDNVAPNIFGGMTLSYQKSEQFNCISLSVSKKYRFVALIPDFKLSTQKAREVLPENYRKEDVVFNLSRVGMLISALQSGNNSLLRDALDDRIHQPYRIPLIKGYHEIAAICSQCGAIGTYLSGAGPTIMAITDMDEVPKKIKQSLREKDMNWQVETLKINAEGLECYKMK
ncbi:MAG: homoserine kinase [Anaerofustis sp.]